MNKYHLLLHKTHSPRTHGKVKKFLEEHFSSVTVSGCPIYGSTVMNFWFTAEENVADITSFLRNDKYFGKCIWSVMKT